MSKFPQPRFNYGAAIVAMRKRKDIRQSELAHHVGISAESLCQMEKGKTRVSIHVLEKASDAFGVSLSDFVRFIEINFKPQ